MRIDDLLSRRSVCLSCNGTGGVRSADTDQERVCGSCQGGGQVHIPPNPWEVRAILASQQREIAALREALRVAGIVIPRAPDNG